MNKFSNFDKQTTSGLPKTQQPNTTFFDDEDDDYDDYPTSTLRTTRHSRSAENSGPQSRAWSSMDGVDSTNFSSKETGTSLLSEIDKKLKEHADVLLHSMETLSAHVSQMESRTQQLDYAFDDLKVYIQFTHGKTDRKLLELENILTEVHGDIRDLRDKQEIAETQLELTKLQLLKEKTQSKKQNSASQLNVGKASSSASDGPSVPSQLPVTHPQHPVTPNPVNASLQTFAPINTATTMQQHPTLASSVPQLPAHLPQNIVPLALKQQPYYRPPVVMQNVNHQQLQVPSNEPSQPSSYWPAYIQHNALLQDSVAHQTFGLVNSQVSYSSSHIPVETFNMSSRGIQRIEQPPRTELSTQQQNERLAYQNYDQTLTRYHSEFKYSSSPALGLEAHGQLDNAYDPHYDPYRSQSDATTMKTLQRSQCPPTSGRESSHSQLPTARILPHAIPTASSVDTLSDSNGGREERVPVNDVVDKVVAMGFRRDVVRATVKKLTEDGKSVDLNLVLDKLMNNG